MDLVGSGREERENNFTFLTFETFLTSFPFSEKRNRKLLYGRNKNKRGIGKLLAREKIK